MSTLLVTGASRGIGLEHVRQALARGERVVAACRQPAAAADLGALAAQAAPGQLRLEALDVSDPASIDALAARLADVPLDILINNAGIYGAAGTPGWPAGAATQSLEAMDYDHWDNVLRTNVIGPFRLTARLLPNLLAGSRKLVVMMSSSLGSITLNTQGTSHAYRSSKAALNMLARGLAVDLKDRRITVIALAPGWTRTELGGSGADWTVHDSVASQCQVLARVGLADSGSYIEVDGGTLPW